MAEIKTVVVYKLDVGWSSKALYTEVLTLTPSERIPVVPVIRRGR